MEFNVKKKVNNIFDRIKNYKINTGYFFYPSIAQFMSRGITIVSI